MLCLHYATIDPVVALREFEAKAQCECLGFGLGRGDMVPVEVGLVVIRHLDDILRQNFAKPAFN